MDTLKTPFPVDPQAALEAFRAGAVAALEGALGFQHEARKAFETGMTRFKSESEHATALTHEAIALATATAFDMSARALAAARDEVARLARTPQA